MKYKTTFFILFCVSLFGLEHIYLKTPNLSKENIIGVNAGIRPYRKNGIRIESERIEDKLILHNYGYGGSGITLCFGGAKEVIEILKTQNLPSKSVAVLGAGVIGLATAYTLLEEGYEVHLYSNEWSPNLTSNVAAGIWSPIVVAEDAPIEKKEFNERILENSTNRFLKSTSDQPEFCGVRFIQSYSFKIPSDQEAIQTKHIGEEVIVHLDNGVTKIGKKAQEIGIDGKLFIEDLYEKVQIKGAILIQKEFLNLLDVIKLEEPTIINCTSMGSRKLFNDEDFLPTRGQIIYFKKDPEIDFLFYENIPDSSTSWVSIYPWSDRIIVGGVYEPKEEDPVVLSNTINMILENAQKSLSEH